MSQLVKLTVSKRNGVVISPAVSRGFYVEDIVSSIRLNGAGKCYFTTKATKSDNSARIDYEVDHTIDQFLALTSGFIKGTVVAINDDDDIPSDIRLFNGSKIIESIIAVSGGSEFYYIEEGNPIPVKFKVSESVSDLLDQVSVDYATKAYADAGDSDTLDAANTYADGLVIGLLDDRGNHDASTNLYPSTGGSGSAGAILKGDFYYISVAGTLGGINVYVGDGVRALVDAPGQTAGNWGIVEGKKIPCEIGVAASDEVTAITTGTAKITFRMPYPMTLRSNGVRASLSTAQTSGNIFTIDINESGSSILSTKITIDNGEKTSTTAATAPVISDVNLADDAEITIDVDQIGDGTAKGVKVWLIGTRAN